MTARVTGQDRVLSERAWTIVVLAVQDASRRFGLEAAVLTVTFADSAGAVPGSGEAALVRNTRLCDLLGRLGRARLGVIAMGCNDERAAFLGRRLQDVLRAEGLSVDVAVSSAGSAVDSASPAPEAACAVQAGNQAFGSSGPITKYAPCNACGRNGVYVSGRFPVIRCKYCGVKRTLDADQWAEANENLGDVARRMPSSLLGMDMQVVEEQAVEQ